MTLGMSSFGRRQPSFTLYNIIRRPFAIPARIVAPVHRRAVFERHDGLQSGALA
jgi:hypothetical protein